MRVRIVVSLFVFLLALCNRSLAQQLKLGDTPGMEKSAVLDLSSTRQGLLLPRIADTTLINSLAPPDGMMIFHSGSSQLMIRKAGHWNAVTTAGGCNTDQVAEGSTNLYYTDARSKAALSASAPLAYNAGTGGFSISQAGSLNNGYLSSSDWNTFNAKQASGDYITALTGDITAAGPGNAAATIAPNAVTFVKMQAITANRLLGSGLSGTSVGEITLGTGLSFSGNTLNATGGTLTSLSVTSANGFAATVANPLTTPAITLSTTVAGLLKGNGTALSAAVAGADFQAPVTLTTTGSSGAATFSSNTLNIPTYTLTGLGGFANPMTTTGDVVFGGASGVATRLAGNTTTGKQFLSSTGTGSAANAPTWSSLANADIVTALGYTPYNSSNPNGYTSNTGTVTTLSIATANGFAGTVANATTTPVITVTSSVNGMVKGDGTSLSAATEGVDYQSPILLSRRTTNLTTTSTTAVTTGISEALEANSTYEVEIVAMYGSSNAAGTSWQLNWSGSGATIGGWLNNTTTQVTAFNTSYTGTATSSNAMGSVKAILVTGGNAGTLTLNFLKLTSGTATIFANSYMKCTKF